MRRQGTRDLEEHPVTGSVASRIVGGLELVYVEERQYERLVRPPRPGYLALQLHKAGIPAIHTGEAVDRGVFSLPRRRPAIGQRCIAVECGLNAFAGSCPAIGQRSIAIEFGLNAFAGPCSAV